MSWDIHVARPDIVLCLEYTMYHVFRLDVWGIPLAIAASILAFHQMYKARLQFLYLIKD